MRHLEDLFPDISILTNGETAMQINGSWSVLRVDSEKYGVVPLPAATAGGDTASVAGGWNVLVSNQSSGGKDSRSQRFLFHGCG